MPDFADYPWLPPVLIVLLWVPLWIGIAYLAAYKTGWSALARSYRAKTPFRGRYVGVMQARFGKGIAGNLNNALLAGAGVEGIWLRMIFLLRPMCPDLFVPWRDVTVRRGKAWLRDYVELTFKSTPELPLRLYGRAGARVQALAGGAWPEPSIPEVIRR